MKQYEQVSDNSILTKSEVYSLIRAGLERAVIDELQKTYNSPVNRVISQVLENNKEELQSVIEEMLTSAIKDKDFVKELRIEFRRKVAKSLVGQLEGAIEKSVNTYRSDPLLKSRMILALETIINEAEND
jgi:formate dehydrogenase maturation protein FdhE